MAQKSLYDLTLNLTANSTELSTALKQANTKLSAFERNAKNVSGKITSVLSFVGVGVGVAAVFKTIKSSIESVEGPGDKLASTMAGAKGAFFEFQRALGTLDFTSFFKKIAEGFEAGKALEEAMDELADRAAYNDYKIAQLERQAASLKEIVKNKTLELSVRTDASEKVLKIEKDIKKRKELLINETFALEKKGWEDKAKMSIEEAAKLDEGLKSQDKVTMDRLDQTWSYITNQIGLRGQTARDKLVEIGNNTGVGGLSGIPKDVIASYAKFQTLQEAQADVMPKMYKILSDYENNLTKAQLDYNGAVKETTGLLEKDEKQVKKETEAAEKAAIAANKLAVAQQLVADKTSNKIDKVPISNLSIPTVSTATDKTTLAPASVKSTIDGLLSIQDKGNLAADAIFNLGNAFTEFAETGKTSMKSVVAATLGGIRQIIMAKLAESLANVITNALSPNPQNIVTGGLWGLAAAAAGMIAITGLWSKIPEFANGGVIGGTSFTGDNLLIRANSGERILTRQQQESMFGGGELKGKLAGNDILISVVKTNKIYNTY